LEQQHELRELAKWTAVKKGRLGLERVAIGSSRIDQLEGKSENGYARS
jgi:hypothetical protein